jgi:hypothetical protein
VPSFHLTLLPERLAICRLPAGALVPEWAQVAGPLVSITRTADELSVVCDEADVPAEVTAERGWRALRVAGPLDFALTGVLAALVAPLAEAGVSIFALSTYDTDYVLVRETDVERAVAALAGAGHTVEQSA